MTDTELDTILLQDEPTRSSLPAAWPRARALHLVDLVGEVSATLFGLGFGVWVLVAEAEPAIVAFGVFVAVFVLMSAAASFAMRSSRARHEPGSTLAFLHASLRNLDLALAHNTFTRVGNVVGGLAAIALIAHLFVVAPAVRTQYVSFVVVAAILVGCVAHTEHARRQILLQRARVEAWLAQAREVTS